MVLALKIHKKKSIIYFLKEALLTELNNFAQNVQLTYFVDSKSIPT